MRLPQWEKSRLFHQARRMQEQGLIVREPDPADARSAMICLLPAGRRAIEDAAPRHAHNVRRHFIDLLTPAELDILAALNERVLRLLAEDPFPEQSAPGGPAPRTLSWANTGIERDLTARTPREDVTRTRGLRAGASVDGEGGGRGSLLVDVPWKPIVVEAPAAMLRL